MKNKFKIFKVDNIFFAKRKLVDNIYKIARFEGIRITLVDR